MPVLRHRDTEFNKLEKFYKWHASKLGGNLFFEEKRLANLNVNLINNLEELFNKCSVNERYDSDLGIVFLLPRVFAQKRDSSLCVAK